MIFKKILKKKIRKMKIESFYSKKIEVLYGKKRDLLEDITLSTYIHQPHLFKIQKRKI